jgi:concanavalin A-like lectin/glucanase superfamily protein
VVGWWPGDDKVSDLTLNANNALRTVSLPLNIGAYLAGGFGWNGRIDELQVYNRVLSAAEVAAHYEAGSAGRCKLALGGTDAGSFNPEAKGPWCSRVNFK